MAAADPRYAAISPILQVEPAFQRTSVVSELVHRGSLAELMSRGFLPHCHGPSGGLALSLAHDAANGLAYLHEGVTPSVLHRDVKAANLLITKDWRTKLANFGFARTKNSAEAAVMTQVGAPPAAPPAFANFACLKRTLLALTDGKLPLQGLHFGPRRKC